jgi:hypothetical protein
MDTAVVALEGVLAGRDDAVNLSQTALDPTGGMMYAGLAASTRLVVATAVDRRLAQHWCRIQGLTGHMDLTALDERTIKRMRASGDNPRLYIDANPDRVAAALRDGVPALLFSRPMFARADHRADLSGERLPKEWAEVTREQKAQQRARRSGSDIFGADPGNSRFGEE